jgi:all-trans-retinol dehydrogenase (NAD+)
MNAKNRYNPAPTNGQRTSSNEAADDAGQFHVNENVQLNQLLSLANVYFTWFLNIMSVLFDKLKQYLNSYFMFTEKSVHNQVVLITGSGGYLGRCLAMEFAKRNAILVLLDVNEEENKKTQTILKENGFYRTHCYTVDLTDHDSFLATSRQVKADVGLVSIVIMAAAPHFKPKSILDTNFAEDIEPHFKIGYTAQLWLMQEFVKPMIANNCGHFVTVSSASALTDLPLISSYASVKLAQAKLLETLRSELLFNGVRDVKTTVVYLSVLTGGLANGFGDSFEFDGSVTVTGERAADAIAQGVLRNRENVFVPRVPLCLVMTMKHLLTPRIMDFIMGLKCKMNPKYMKLRKQRSD